MKPSLSEMICQKIWKVKVRGRARAREKRYHSFLSESAVQKRAERNAINAYNQWTLACSYKN